MQASPKKFKAVDISKIGNSEIALGELEEKNTFDRVSVDVKVLRVGEPVMVSGGIKNRM